MSALAVAHLALFDPSRRQRRRARRQRWQQPVRPGARLAARDARIALPTRPDPKRIERHELAAAR